MDAKQHQYKNVHVVLTSATRRSGRDDRVRKEETIPKMENETINLLLEVAGPIARLYFENTPSQRCLLSN